MSYTIQTSKHEGYLHAVVTGENTPENVRAYLMNVRDLCSQNDCTRVLIEENLDGPALPVMKIYEIISQASKNVWPAIHDIAFVDINPGHDHSGMQFAEDVAVNRGIHVKLCTTVGEAEKWLQTLTQPDP